MKSAKFLCAFLVSMVLRSTDPDSYTPQEVAIGPYHHWRPELYEMARYKLAAARNFQKQLQNNLKIEQLVDELIQYGPHIRACHNRYLGFRGETLAWMMAIDASFILEFLQVHAINSRKVETSAISSMIWLIMKEQSQLTMQSSTKMPHINKAIEDVNKYYNSRWKVKARKTLKFYVYSSWQFLTLVAAIMLLLLMTVQAFCSVYSCPRVFHFDDSVSHFSSALSPP